MDYYNTHPPHRTLNQNLPLPGRSGLAVQSVVLPRRARCSGHAGLAAMVRQLEAAARARRASRSSSSAASAMSSTKGDSGTLPLSDSG